MTAKKLGRQKIYSEKFDRLEVDRLKVDRLKVDRSTPVSLGERVSLEGSCSCPTGIGVVKKGGMLAPPLPKRERGDLDSEGPCALGKWRRGRPDVTRIAPKNIGALQEVE